MKPKDNFLDSYKLPDPVCLNKWAWSTIHLSVGQTMSCHRVNGDTITPETYADFHNTPSKLRDRQRMLSGQWPDSNGPTPIKKHSGCEVCREVEAANGVSDRLSLNSNSAFQYRVPKELKEDNRSINVTPTTLEVYFNNQCNLSCIYCSPKFSSKIAAENLKYDPENSELQNVLNYRKDYPKLLESHFKWLEKNVSSLNVYKILGGEPFIQKELDQNIDFFENFKCPQLNVAIFTNLNINHVDLKDKLGRISSLIKKGHLNSVTLYCSFDCWGPQVEYLRHGSNLKKWEDNFLILLTQYPEIDVCIHSTLTALTFSSFPDLVERIKYWNLVRPIRQSISTVDSRPFLYPGILPIELISPDIQKSIDTYEDIIKLTMTRDYTNEKENKKKNSTIAHFRGVIEQLKGYEKTFIAHEVDSKVIIALTEFLNTNDHRRGTDWKSIWPWLVQLKDLNSL
jgi:hypothetical protein